MRGPGATRESILLNLAGLYDYCRNREAGILCDLNRIKLGGVESFRDLFNARPKAR